jgi:hypothetical protein
MTTKTKKGLLIALSIFLFIFITLMTLPFAFKGKIMTVAKEQINKDLLAKVGFEDLDLSFIRSFPNASVRLEKLSVIGIGEFKKDTLFYTDELDLVVNLSSLFSGKGYEVKKIALNNSHIFAHVLPNGKNNWSITKPDTTKAPVDTTAMRFNLKLKNLEINNANITYWDEAGKMKAVVRNLNHKTAGDLTADSTLLKTRTAVETLDFWMGSIKYMSKVNLEFNADLHANLNKMIFGLSENETRINGIQFSFNGWVQLLKEGMDMNLTLDTKKVDFKSILSLVPAIYTNSFEDVKTGGTVKLSGFVKGKMVGTQFPTFDLKLNVDKAWFQYPKLPQSVQNINIATHVYNTGSALDQTVVDVSNFSLVMAKNPFSAKLHVTHPMTDPELEMKAAGKIDLGSIKELYPLDAEMKLNGIFEMNMEAGGKMSYLDQNQYDKFHFGGKLNLSNMLLKMKELPQELSISKANMTFNNNLIDLSALQIKIGRNDIAATGKVENFMAYALHNKILLGKLNLQSNYFNASDFMSSKPAATPEKSEPLTVIEIPKNINFTMGADFKQLVYEKMNFTNAKGQLVVVDGALKFQNLFTQAFGGNMLVNGAYSTTDPKKPSFDFDLGINEVAFKEIFKQVGLAQKLVPIFEKANGNFSSKLSISSLLKNDMMPDMGSLTGKGSFSTKSIGLANIPVLTSLGKALKVKELNNTQLKDVAFMFEIKDGKITTQPFDVVIAGVKMNLGGTTGLDQSIAYTGKVQMPDKLNLGKLSTVGLKIGGTFTKPTVALDLANTLKTMAADAKTKAVAEVTKQVDAAKTKALDEARRQKEMAIKAAQEKAAQIRATAQQLSDKLINEAQSQADQLIAKATNPITKKLAQTASQKLIDDAKRKAAQYNTQADEEAKKVVQKAETSF